MSNKTIVITGCSSGFGRITALRLVKEGWHVFATVRKEVNQADLVAEVEDGYKDNLTPILCDITNTQQVAALAQRVAEATPRLDALLNNAGTAFAAPLELMPLDDLRAQLEVNVIGHVGVIQALLPLLKAARGTIINVSSVGGRVSIPVGGAYSASKFALEALSDALRLELAPFGVRVVVIEPSSSPTDIWKVSMKRALDQLQQHREGPYARLLARFEKIARVSASRGFPPTLFADTIERILSSKNPRTRYVVPPAAAIEVGLRRFLPDALFDRILRATLRW